MAAHWNIWSGNMSNQFWQARQNSDTIPFCVIVILIASKHREQVLLNWYTEGTSDWLTLCRVRSLIIRFLCVTQSLMTYKDITWETHNLFWRMVFCVVVPDLSVYNGGYFRWLLPMLCGARASSPVHWRNQLPTSALSGKESHNQITLFEPITRDI